MMVAEKSQKKTHFEKKNIQGSLFPFFTHDPFPDQSFSFFILVKTRILTKQ